MSDDLQNPFRLSTFNETYDVGELLGDDRVVTKIECKPQEGNIYVHWKFSERVKRLNDLLQRWRRAESFARDSGRVAESDGVGACADELHELLRNCD